jgi:Domain of unknown function (DUF4426)
VPKNITLIKRMFAAMTLTVCGFASAGEPLSFGEYTVHYNAFNTDTLQPAMADAYNIVRSKNRGMITISVMKKNADKGPMGTPVRANVTASASNLTGQFREFTVREVDEGNSIYYLSEFHVAHEEILNFMIQVLPEGGVKPFTVEFRQKFYTQ